MNSILQVETNPTDCLLVQQAIRQAGVTSPIRVVRDGQQAIDFLSAVDAGAGEEASLPYLVILDFQLPFVMGFDLLRWIRQQPRAANVRVILLSPPGEEIDAATAYRLGVHEYLVKPAEASQLEETARTIKDFWSAQAARGPVTLSHQNQPLPV